MNERFVTVKTILFSQICVHLSRTQIKTEFVSKKFWKQEKFYHGIRTSLGWLCSLWSASSGFSYCRNEFETQTLSISAMAKDMKSRNSNKVFSLGIKIASRVLIVIYWIMKERISILFPEFQRNEAVIFSIPKGMNPFAAGMSMFVSLLSAMTIIGLPVEGMGLLGIWMLSMETEYYSLSPWKDTSMVTVYFGNQLVVFLNYL